MAASGRRLMATVSGTPEKLGITLVRLVVGVVFAMHGYQKWFVFRPAGTVDFFQHKLGMPPVAAYATMTAELLCGVLLILGLLTRLAAIPIVVVMGVAITQVHLAGGFFAPAGFEYPLTLGVCALGLVLAGPGTLALDNLIA